MGIRSHEMNIFMEYMYVSRNMSPDLTFYGLAVSLRTARFNIQKFYMALALPCVFCMDISTDSDFCFIHH